MALSKSKLLKKDTKTSASHKVEAYLKQCIFQGNLHPRERIIEDDLANRLAVSRGTVREALLRLERDGLVVTTSRRGTFVRDISLQEIGVIFNIRGKLEGLCVRYMREAMRPEDEGILREAIQKLKLATARNDDDQFFYADMELHQTIWKLSGQPQLYRILNLVMNPFIFIIARNYSSNHPIRERFKNHCDYVEIILKRPIKRVEREVELHFQKLHRKYIPPTPSPYPSPLWHSALGQHLWTDSMAKLKG